MVIDDGLSSGWAVGGPCPTFSQRQVQPFFASVISNVPALSDRETGEKWTVNVWGTFS